MPDRGVSEVIGFILVFSLISIAVGAVYVAGFGGLQDARDAEQLNNVERAYDVLADNLDDIHHDDAPHRATELKMYDASVTLAEETRFTVTLSNVGGNPTYSVRTSSIAYEPRGSSSRFLYVAGGVIREDRNGAIFLDEPEFVFHEQSGDRTAVIPIIQTRSSDQEAASGTGTVLVRGTLAISETLAARTTPLNASTSVDGDSENEYEVTLTVESSEVHAQLWEQYLDAEIETAYPSVSDPCSMPTDGTVECVFPAERVFVSATRIDVSIES